MSRVSLLPTTHSAPIQIGGKHSCLQHAAVERFQGVLGNCISPCAPRCLGPAVQVLPLMTPPSSGTQRDPAVPQAGRAQAEVCVSWLLSSLDLGLIVSYPLVLVLTYVQTGHRCNAPFTPKVLLCGPSGSGKRLQATLLAQKYDLVNGEYLTQSAAACLPPRQALCVAGWW